MGRSIALGTVAVAVFAVSLMVLTSVNSFIIAASAGNPPEWQNQTQAKDSINPGESNVLSAQGRSTVGLNSAWLATNEGGPWHEYKTGLSTIGWWNDAWGKRAKLQINNLGQPEDLLNFPLLVVLGPNRISYGDFKSDGSDIRFLDSSGTELISHIEKWDTSGSSYVWVKVPKITANSASDYIWLYYGNPSAPNVRNSAATFDSSFVGVWHMNETSSVKDSTSNANHGTSNGATYTSSAMIDGGYSFNGASSFIDVPASASLKLIGVSFTMEAWVKFSGAINNARLISMNIDTYSNVYQLISDRATTKWGVHVREGGTDRICSFSSSSVSSGIPYYVAAVINKNGNDYSGSKLYVNGVEVTMTTSAGAIGANGPNTDLLFGKRADGYGTGGIDSTYLNGIEDEVRLSNAPRSASWIKATYLTGSDQIITYGTVESKGFTPEKYGSPILLGGVSNTWVTASFTWSNASIRSNTAISWKIVFKDTTGALVETPEKTFSVLKPLNALVLVNSQSPNFADFQGRIYPYLKHFGIPYDTLDVSNTPVTAAIGDYPLIIIGHSSLDPAHACLDSAEQSLIANAVNQGTGLVNFDFNLQSGTIPIYNYVQTIFGFSYGLDYSTASPITIVTNQNYITSQQQGGSSYSLSGSVVGANIVGASPGVNMLVSIGGHPLVDVTTYGQGKAVQFSTYNFLDWNIFGYFQGIDDIFWKSFVWAAEKPFVMRGIPPFVTMRFDDCDGPYAPYISQTQLNGFTPMVSSFLATQDVAALKSYALSGDILVSVHEDTIGYTPATVAGFWSQYDNVFTNQGIPMAHSWHAHVAETSSALIPGMKARGIDLFCTDCDFDTYLGNVGTNRWAPYMVDQHSPAARNAYIFEDWCKVDSSFFNYYSNAWAYGSPLNSVFIDNHIGDVQGAVNEGVARVERALNSQTWGLLMTHEFAIEAFGYGNFGTAIGAIKAQVSADGYTPIYTDVDTIGYYVRAATGTSHLSYASVSPGSDAVTVKFTGSADVPTKFYLFTGANDNIRSTLVDVPTFTNGFTMTTGIPTVATPPAISKVGSKSVTQSSATITWDTNEAADSRVDYGTTSSLGNEVHQSFAALQHSIQLGTLTPETTYNYKVSSTDADGNTAVSVIFQFTTAAAPPADTTPPTISNVDSQSITESSATIIWDTDEAADSRVDYGTTSALGNEVYQASATPQHSIQLGTLTPETIYFYKVSSTDASGNMAESAIFQFTTAAAPPPDTTPPVISNVGSQSITESSATITWITDEAADSRVDYGTTALDHEAYESFATLQHSIQLTTLTPETTYYYTVTSADAHGNTAESSSFQFTTTAAPPFSLLLTTYKDFASGTLTDTFVTNDTGGEVMLKPVLFDHFDNSKVNTDIWRATRGQYTPGLVDFDPTMTGSVMTMDNPAQLYGGGARLMSKTFYSPPITIEGRIKLTGNGAGCLFGLYDWAADHDYYVDFNCLSGSPHTRVSLPGYSASNVAVSFDPNQFHILRIEYTSTTVRFYVDGALVDTRTGTFSTPMPILFGAFPTGPTYADWIRVDTFPVTTGTFLSAVLDAHTQRQWDTLDWTANTPAGTSLTFMTRTSTDNIVWSDWSATTTSSGSQIASPDGRYIQYSVDFVTTNSRLSPVLESVELMTRRDTTPPVVTISAPLDGAYYKSSAVPVGAFSVFDTNPYTTVEAGWSSADGVHTYTVTATDGAGNVGSASVTYTVDDTAPVVTITSPSEGAYYTTAHVPPAGYTVSELNPYSVAVSGYLTSEGAHTYTVTATDGAGNSGTASVTYTVDNTLPVVTISAPLNGAYYKSANVPDAAYGVVDTNPWTAVESGYSKAEGVQTYTVTVTDGAGNVGTASVTYTVDNTAPVVTISAPLDGAYYQSSVVPVGAFSVVEINPYTPVEAGWSSADGVHTYTVTATDGAGNVGSASVTYTVDDTAPVVTITSPSDGAYYKTSAVPVGAFSVIDTNPYTTVEAGWSNVEGVWTYTVTATDGAGNLGSDSVTYTVDNTAPVVTISAPSNGAYYKSVNVPAAAYSVVDTNPCTVVESGYSTVEGVQTYTVTATDGAGNIGTASVTYTVDNTAPVVTILAPLSGHYYKSSNVPDADYDVVDTNPCTVVESGYSTVEGIQTYTVTATDGAGNVGSDSVAYTVDDTAPVVTITSPLDGAYHKTSAVPGAHFTVTETNPWTASESGYSTSEGVHTYTVTVTDDAGNVGTDSVTYTVDNTPPVVTILSPSDGAYYQIAPASAYSVVEINPGTLVETGYSTSEGVHTYTVTATDLAGNVGTASVTYTVDSIAPVVTITSPLSGAYYTTGHVPSAGYTVSDVNLCTVVESGYSTVEGVQIYTVTATDPAGNVGTASVTYTVDNTLPVVTITAPVNGAYYKTSAVPTGAFSVVDTSPYTTVESGWSNLEGVWTYTVTATDGAGNVGSASVTYTVDNTPPVVTISAPLDGACYKTGDVPAKAYKVTDNLDPSPVVVETGYSTADGVQTYTVTATDAAGNSASASVTYIVDNTSPVVTITAPLTGHYYKTGEVPTGAFTVVDTSPYTTTEAGWTNSPDGSYTYIVTVTDAAGNVGTASVTYTVDNTAPVVSISAPLDGHYYKTSAMPAGAFTVVEINPYTTSSSGYSTAEGVHTYTVTATDSAGNAGSAPVTYTVDDTAPVVTINAPMDGAYYKSANVPDAAYGVLDSNPYTVAESGYSKADGIHTYTVTATDSAGNVGSASVSYTVDDTAPVVTITAPVNGAYYQVAPVGVFSVVEINPYTTVEAGWSNVDGVQTYTVTATDGAGNVGTASVTYTVDSIAPVVTITAPAAGFYQTSTIPTLAYDVVDANSHSEVVSGWDTATEGSHTVTVTSTDAAGNIGSASVTYTIDNTAPMVTITSPLNGAYYKISAMPAGAFTVVELNPYTTSSSGYSTAEGVHTYTVTVTDGAGNVGTASVMYTVDNTAPVVTISAPLDGAYYQSSAVPVGAFSVVDTSPWTPVEAGWSSADGVHTYTVTVTDSAGNVGSASVTYAVDDTAPVVTITAPLTGHYYKTGDVPTGAFTATDLNGVVSTTEAGWANSPDGSYTYIVTATDAAGNVGTASVTYTVDNVAPVVTITAPVNGAYYKIAPAGAFSVVDANPYSTAETGWSSADGVHTYTVTVTDGAGNVGTASVTYTVDSIAPVVAINSPVNGAYYQIAPGSAYTVVETNPGTVVESGYSAADGVHTYTVTVTDLAGNVGTDSVTYTVDSIAPVVTITSPLSGAYYTSGHVPAAHYTVSDVNACTVVESGYSTAEGVQTYRVTATDPAGNVGMASVMYTVDNTAPVVTISAPLNGAYYRTSAVPAGAFTATDLNGVASTTEAGWANSPDGSYTYFVTATDAAGNTGFASVMYEVDNIAPVVTINAPVAGAYYKSANVPAAGDFTVFDANPYTTVEAGWSNVDGVQTYTVTATDGAGNVGTDSATYTVDDTTPVVTITAPTDGAYYTTAHVPAAGYTVSELNPYTVAVSGYLTSEGVHTYTVTATDSAGNVGTASVTYTVDNTPPIVTILAPLSGHYYKTVNVPAAAYGVVETNPWTPVETGYSTSEGVHTYTVTVTDGAGNVGAASVTYTVDNTAPVVKINAPLNGAYYQSSEVPAGAFSVVDTSPWTPVESGWSNAEGVHTYTVTVTDSAGNVGSDSVTYTVDDTAPVVTITAPVNGAYYQVAPVGVFSVVEINPYTTVSTGWSSLDGSHTYTVTATDLAGNSGTASVTYTVDSIAPVVTITSPLSGAYYKSGGVPVAGYTVSDVSACTEVESGYSTVEGVHTYTVTATDSAGNVGTASVTYTVDNTAPVVTINAPLDGAYYQSSAVPVGAYSVVEINPYTPVEAGWSSADGVQTYTVTVTDSAGNVGSDSVTYTVDDTAPVVTITAPVNGAYYKIAPVGVFSVVEINPYTTVEAGWSSLDGVHTYTVTATDGAGNVGTASVTYTVDSIAPVVTITSPLGGAYYTTAHVPAAHYTVSDVSLCTVVESGYSTVEGVQTYMVTATDPAGNVGTASVTYTVDNTAPVVSILSPLNGHCYRTVNVPVGSFTATDLNGVVSHTEAGWASSPEGSYTYTVTVTDAAGNTGSASVTYTVDNTPPAVMISAPLDGAYYKTSAVPAGAFSATDLNGVVSHTEAGWANSPEGSYTYTVTATDAAGNVGAASVTYTVDNTAPIITGAATTSPNSNGWWNTDVTIHFTAADGLSGVASVTVDQVVSTEGYDQQVTGTAVDKAGNSATFIVHNINIDMTSPIISGAPTTLANGNGWYNHDVTVHFDATDTGGSGVASCTFDQTLTAEAKDQSVTGTAVDRAGNSASLTVSGINIDKTVPTISGAPTSSPNGNGWYNHGVTVVFSSCDDLGGSGIDWATDSWIFSSEGKGQSVTGEAWDLAGNSASVTVGGVNIDMTPPTISGAATTSPNANDWYNTAVTVHFTVSDGLSGVLVAPADVVLPNEGAAQSTGATVFDLAGNSASTIESGINIDKTPPVVTAAYPHANANGWYNYDVTVDFSATDALSGVGSYPTDVSLSEGKAQSATGTATDLAGNVGTFTISGINIDKTAPTISGSRTPGANSHGWNNVDVTVSFHVGDSLSGLDLVTIPSDTTLGEGAGQSVMRTVYDLAGNSASATVSNINIDKTSPTITGSRTPGANSHGWNNEPVTVSFSASDLLSGVDTFTPPVTLSSEGAGQSVTGTVYDLAGNSASSTVDDVNIDMTAPTISGAATTSPNGNGWYNHDVIVHFVATDYGGSGVWSYTPDQTLTAEAMGQSISGIAVDKAGNSASFTVSGINIDKTKSIISGSRTPAANSWGWNNQPVTVSFTASDSLSGVYSVSAPVILSSEGAGQSVTGTVLDLAGNSASTTVSDINIDLTAPTISGSRTPDANSHHWNNEPVTVSFSVGDSLSGINLATIPSPTTLGEGAGQSVLGVVYDLAGNSNSATVSNINIDMTLPTISGAATTSPNAYGWYRTDVVVQFTASDVGGSGIDKLTPDTTLSAEGAGQHVLGTAVDMAGNSATHDVTGINIDKTVPTISGSRTPGANSNGWNNGDVTVSYSATDSLSGLATVDGPMIVSTEGAGQSRTGTAVDKAGNSASVTVSGISIDKTPPTISGSRTPGANSHGWNNVDVTVHFVAGDSLSGVASFTPDKTITGEGAGQSVTGTVFDWAGNSASTTVSGINIDKTKPVISGSRTPAANSWGWNNQPVTVSFTASDSLSGINIVSAPVVLSSEGAGQSVIGTACDLAGNPASMTVSGISIDMTAPTISGSRLPVPNSNGWNNGDVTVSFSATDSLSGIASASGPAVVSTEGAGQSRTGTALDKAGNPASTTVTDINIDKTKPTTALTIGDPKSGLGPTYVSLSTLFSLSGTDSISGVYYSEYSFVELGSMTRYAGPFHPPGIGTYTLWYRSVDKAGNVETTQSIQIVVNAVILTYTGETSGNYSDPAHVSAMLVETSSGAVIPGKSILFTIGSQMVSATTGSNGVATASIVLNQPAGSSSVKATFAGDGSYTSASASKPFTIAKEDATVVYTGDTVVPTTTKQINLRATVYESQDGSLGNLVNMKVTFTVYSPGVGGKGSPVVTPMTVTVAPVSGSPGIGVATGSIGNLGEGSYLIEVSVNPSSNVYYTASTSEDTLTVYLPTGTFVTGGGWIDDTSGGKGHFSFVLRYNKNGQVQGQSLYIYSVGSFDYFVKSTAWTGLAIDGSHAYFQGKCVALKYDHATGMMVWSEGNYQFRVDVWDNTPTGGKDAYQINVRDKNGVVWHTAGFNPYGTLKGGEIVVHLEKKATSAAVIQEPLSPTSVVTICCLLATVLLSLKGLVAIARRPGKIGHRLALVKRRAMNQDRSSARRTLRLPCTLAELD